MKMQRTGDEADSLKLQKLAEQAKAFHHTGTDDDDSDEDFSDDDDDDEEMQSPIDDVDPFVYFMETVKVMQAVDPGKFQNLSQSLVTCKWRCSAC
ncbi:unnamed protein product [Rhodiola kirilowii]